MKIAVTGHTSGIGKAIFDRFSAAGHTVRGFSRVTGHDITHPVGIQNIVDATWNYDIFINNAYHKMAQVDLLYAKYDQWRNEPSRIIVNISSMTGDGIKNFRHPYAIYKTALDKAVEQLQNVSRRKGCRILNIRPGYVDTPMISEVDEPKMSPEYIAEVVEWMVNQPALVKTLTIVP